MKKLLLFSALLLVPALTFVSCDKDDNGNYETTYPTPPVSDPVAMVGEGNVTLTWTAPESENVKEYSIFWNPGEKVATVKAGTNSYTATDLTNGTEYTFIIKAVYNNGILSDASDVKATPVVSPAPMPTELAAEPGNQQVVLTWVAPENEGLKEYAISWAPGDGSAVVEAGTTTYTATGLTNQTPYTFSVAAVYTNGKQSNGAIQSATPATDVPTQTWAEDAGINALYLNNGQIQLGVNKDHGGSIFHFSEVNTKRNLLNHADGGRFIQQSYYGETDGSKWNGKPWVWNPIQGGGWQGQKPKIISMKSNAISLNIVSVPVHWATGALIEDCEMEETITLEGNVAHIHYIFRNTGANATDHPATEQEVPAVFVDYALPNLVYYDGNSPWTGGALKSEVPGWPNEKRTRTEHWAAYVDNTQWGIGVYSPGTSLSTTYRFQGTSGPTGGGCSYFAPLRQFAVEKGMVFEYDVFLNIGKVDEIRNTFNDIRMKGWEIDDSKYSKGSFYIQESNDVTVEEEAVSQITGSTYNIKTTGTKPSITTQRISYATSNNVLTFEYKSSKEIPLSVIMSDLATAPTKIMPLAANTSSDWKTYSFDLGYEIDQLYWGGIGSRIQLFLGDQAGVNLSIRKLSVRPRTAEEIEVANSLFITFTTDNTNDLDECKDITDYFSYTTGRTYLYKAKENAGDPNVWTAPRPRAIAADENKLSFEYKCEKGGELELFLKVVGGGSFAGMNFPASATEWKSVTFDISKGKADVLKAYPDACDKGGQMRFDINGTGGTAMYIRNIRIHK